MDSSDGLLDAITQICRASGVGAKIDRQLLPISPSLQAYGLDPLDWIMAGGEDFELVLCLPQNTAQMLVKQLGNGSAIVGYTTEATELWLTNGNDDKLLLASAYQSFQHF
jgi:thiamine-monophosphate kinase